PGLLPVDHPARALFRRSRQHPCRIRSEPRLGQPKAPDRLARLQLRQPSLLLILAAVSKDRIHHQPALHAREAPHARIAALQLLHQQPVLDVAHPRAAVPFQIRPEEPKPSHLRHQLHRKPTLAITLANPRRDAIVDKLPRRLPDHFFLFAELGIDEEVIYAGESSHAGTILLSPGPWSQEPGTWILISAPSLPSASADECSTGT